MSEEKELIISEKYPSHTQIEDGAKLMITNRFEYFVVSNSIMTSIKNHSEYLSRCYFDDNMTIIIDDNLDKHGLIFLLDSILSLYYEGVPNVNQNIAGEQNKYVLFRYNLGLKQKDGCSESIYDDIDEYDDLPSLESLSSDSEDEICDFSDSDDE